MSTRTAAEARAEARRIRGRVGGSVGLALLGVVQAAIRWFDDSPAWLAWTLTLLAVAGIVVAGRVWRKQRALGWEPAKDFGVQLLAVDETVLARLVGAALAGADPDEVTPPIAGPTWGTERIEWLRRFHRDRRPGLDGPLGEATWAVAVDGEVVGGVRLKRTAEPDVLETGIWLAWQARGKGVARKAIADVLERARARGARAVRADTSRENASALYVLQRLGFRTLVEGGRVVAVKTLV